MNRLAKALGHPFGPPVIRQSVPEELCTGAASGPKENPEVGFSLWISISGLNPLRTD